MKKLLFGVMLSMSCATAKASPYVYFYPFTNGSQLNTSVGALFDSHFSNAGTFYNLAVAYHPLSSGSIIPESYQAYIPPESWAFNCGAGSSGGIGQFGCGPSLNLLDSVRAWTSNLLKQSSNPSLQSAGQQIAPGSGPLNIQVGYQPTDQLFVNGQFGKNPLKFTNHWFIGAGYSF